MASTRDRSFHASYPDPVPTQSNVRQPEDSTTTVRRPSYNDTEGGASITATSPTDDSGERMYQGMEFNDIMNVGDLEGLGTSLVTFVHSPRVSTSASV